MDLETKIELAILAGCIIGAVSITQFAKSRDPPKNLQTEKDQISTNSPTTDYPPIPNRISRTVNAINYAEQLNQKQATQPKYQ